GFAGGARRRGGLAWAGSAGPGDAAVEALRPAVRGALADEMEMRVRAAVAGGHLPEQDAGAAAAALVGLLLEGLIGPLAPPAEGSAARANVQALTLLALRALGVVDARARGLVVQTVVPDEDAA